jgi:hypothetical protein
MMNTAQIQDAVRRNQSKFDVASRERSEFEEHMLV